MGKNHILFHKVDFQIKFIDRHIVFEVAIKTVGLFNQQHEHARLSFICESAHIQKPFRVINMPLGFQSQTCGGNQRLPLILTEIRLLIFIGCRHSVHSHTGDL